MRILFCVLITKTFISKKCCFFMDERKSYSAYLREKFPPKEGFVKKMEALLGEAGAKEFFDISYTKCPSSIRCNTLKMDAKELLKRLKNYGWIVRQPFKDFPEVMIVDSGPGPGDLGKTREHLLGYYYVQEISSMLPMMALRPEEGDHVLDLCASPGSKTTQAAAMMKNGGFILANELNMGRIGILNSNLERCGVMNTIVCRMEGVALCDRLFKKSQFRFDKILVDAPCSGEGTLRKSPKTFEMWNPHMIRKIAKTQRALASAAFKLLKVDGVMIYSTCTLSPEENEMTVNYLLRKFDCEVEKLSLPLKFRSGVCEWEGEKFSDEVSKCLRLYPQDNDTDGFFVARIRKISDEVKR